VEDNWNLPPLGANDSQATSLLNALNFNQQTLSPLVLQTRNCSTNVTPTPTMNPNPTNTPTPTPNVTVTPTPTSQPGQTIAQDTFQRPNQTFWGTATDGQKWGADANTLSSFTISNNTGKVVETSKTIMNATLGPSNANVEVLGSGAISVINSSNHFGVTARWTGANNFYRAYISGSSLIIQKDVSGSFTQLANVPFAASTNTTYSIRFNVTGTTLNAKVWQTGTPEPTNWMATGSDSSLSSGFTGIRFVEQSGTTATIVSFQTTAQ